MPYTFISLKVGASLSRVSCRFMEETKSTGHMVQVYQTLQLLPCSCLEARNWPLTSVISNWCQHPINIPVIVWCVCGTLRSWFHACLGQSTSDWRTTEHWHFILKILYKPWNTLLWWNLREIFFNGPLTSNCGEKLRQNFCLPFFYYFDIRKKLKNRH